jgi:plasmid stabilization system protein ParE
MKVKLIAGFPERYPLYNEQTNIREAVLNRYCVIFYKEFEEEISIVSVFDTRQDPHKITAL